MKLGEEVTYNSTSIVTALIPVQTTFDRSKIVLVLEKILKRCIDILGGICGIIVLIPLTIGIYIANLIVGDKGPIFFTQERYGKNGKIFKMYKYRSMVVGADEKLKEYLENNEEAREEYKKYKKLKNDPRITKVGKVIRKLSIDELPQLINVLKGDMSIIGNRPYLPREKEDMEDFYEDIIKTKPGITGYWQVNGRSKTTFKERLELERYYSNNYSLILDIKIFFKTFKVVLFGKDAN